MLKIAWSSKYCHPLPEGHRFPMEKYELIPEQLLYEGTISEKNLFEPGIVEDENILLVHGREYLDKLNNLNLNKTEERRLGLPLSAALVVREKIIMQGTLTAALSALQSGVGMNVAGGTHHAHKSKGEGFCLLNDIAIAAGYLLKNRYCNKILVVDLDVHQGDGTADIFSEEKRVFTFSMHGENNFPLKKVSSDMDIGLPDGTTDEKYLSTLKLTLEKLKESVKPDFVFYQSGVDILGSDKLGKLAVSKNGCKERDRMVLQMCKELKVPVCISMGGGYSADIREIVDAHCNTFRLVQALFF